jgi:hypothetical protein
MIAIRPAAALAAVLALVLLAGAPPAAAGPRPDARTVLSTWYGLVLELVRHTPTYSPPVASRAFAYLGVTAYEATAGGDPSLVSLAGQLSGLPPPPAREAGAVYDEAAVLEAALSAAARAHFRNTGPTGQRAMTMIEAELSEAVVEGLPPDVADRSAAYGRAVAEHVLAWSAGDGGAVVENMGFPLEYALADGPGHWVPTSAISQQQRPLLPNWGANRAFAMPDGAACDLPPPPAYDEAEGSPFWTEAREVYDVTRALTADQRAVARFWSDDPMLSPTPPGHWISIAIQVLDHEDAPAARRVDLLARLGVTLADAFIGCWHTKYQYDLLRPVTYVRRLIDPKWEPLLITPPFPEYPSGHSTQSAAAAEVLTAFFGEGYAFRDATHEADGIPPREYRDFRAAAREAALSRLYGGIHFRSAIERGLEQGRCVGAYAVALVTRR